jgi:hypothetical protein
MLSTVRSFYVASTTALVYFEKCVQPVPPPPTYPPPPPQPPGVSLCGFGRYARPLWAFFLGPGLSRSARCEGAHCALSAPRSVPTHCHPLPPPTPPPCPPLPRLCARVWVLFSATGVLYFEHTCFQGTHTRSWKHTPTTRPNLFHAHPTSPCSHGNRRAVAAGVRPRCRCCVCACALCTVVRGGRDLSVASLPRCARVSFARALLVPLHWSFLMSLGTIVALAMVLAVYSALAIATCCCFGCMVCVCGRWAGLERGSLCAGCGARGWAQLPAA